jgi:hypothetical protein
VHELEKRDICAATGNTRLILKKGTSAKANRGSMRIQAQQQTHTAEQFEMRDICNGKWLTNKKIE